MVPLTGNTEVGGQEKLCLMSNRCSIPCVLDMRSVVESNVLGTIVQQPLVAIGAPRANFPSRPPSTTLRCCCCCCCCCCCYNRNLALRAQWNRDIPVPSTIPDGPNSPTRHNCSLRPDWWEPRSICNYGDTHCQGNAGVNHTLPLLVASYLRVNHLFVIAAYRTRCILRKSVGAAQVAKRTLDCGTIPCEELGLGAPMSYMDTRLGSILAAYHHFVAAGAGAGTESCVRTRWCQPWQTGNRNLRFHKSPERTFHEADGSVIAVCRGMR
jgi:hypothetical protein